MSKISIFFLIRYILAKPLHLFVKNRKGVAATEFAMVVPIMIGLYMGAVEVGQALTIDRKLTGLASAAADLVAQSKSITESEIQDIFKITDSILEPFDTATLKITLSSVVSDTDNKQSVEWSVSNAGLEHSIGSSIPGMSADATEANSSVIVAEVKYTYTSPVSYYFTGDTNLSEMFFARPRKSLTVELTN
ncbi:MAG: TadE/TadG family type IV pilus assembly protein [Methyloligellaceae bacterium]